MVDLKSQSVGFSDMEDIRHNKAFSRMRRLFKKESFPVFGYLCLGISFLWHIFTTNVKRAARRPDEIVLGTIVLGTIGFYFTLFSFSPASFNVRANEEISFSLVRSVFADSYEQNFEQAVFSAKGSPVNPEYYDPAEVVPVSHGVGIIDDAFRSNAMPIVGTADRDGVVLYSVRKGDTIERISSFFGVSVDTILLENGLKQRQKLRVGQEILILPISGVRYVVREGDSLEGIAEKYNANVAAIVEYNRLSRGVVKEGDVLFLPDVSAPYTKHEAVGTSQLVNVRGYFKAPTTGRNFGILHAQNGVDIANVCGTLITAAAEGLVVEAKTGWNGGYGNYIKIEHPNGVFTKYAHLASMQVGYGDYVGRGQQIALMGNTGETHGATGCHLHFEVQGATNPFAK